jgi:hypothetical protein
VSVQDQGSVTGPELARASAAELIGQFKHRLAARFPDADIGVLHSPDSELVITEWTDGPLPGQVLALLPEGLASTTLRSLSERTVATTVTAWWLRGADKAPDHRQMTPETAASADPRVVELARTVHELLLSRSSFYMGQLWHDRSVDVYARALFEENQRIGPVVAAAAGIDLTELSAGV